MAEVPTPVSDWVVIMPLWPCKVTAVPVTAKSAPESPTAHAVGHAGAWACGCVHGVQVAIAHGRGVGKRVQLVPSKRAMSARPRAHRRLRAVDRVDGGIGAIWAGDHEVPL